VILSEYFELFLTTVGILVAISVTLSELPGGEKGLALTFLVWLQGFILWAVHRHNWFRRQALLRQMRLMLQDRVNNQLTVMLSVAEVRGREMTESDQADMEPPSAGRGPAACPPRPVHLPGASIGPC